MFLTLQNSRWYHLETDGENNGTHKLYVDPLIRMTLHVPAGTVAEVGKQGAHAHLALLLREVVFGSAVLFVNRVVGLDDHGRKRIAAFRNLVPDREIIPDIRHQRQQNYSTNNAE
jgi:hypothetical protein